MVDLKNITILCVEDVDFSRWIMDGLLKDLVKNVYLANNGDDGLKKYKLYSPDLIITDIMMPVFDGIEMIKKIREIDKSTPIIVVSGHDDAKDSLEGLVDIFLVKPIMWEQLKKNIEDVLNNSKK